MKFNTCPGICSWNKMKINRETGTYDLHLDNGFISTLNTLNLDFCGYLSECPVFRRWVHNYSPIYLWFSLKHFRQKNNR